MAKYLGNRPTAVPLTSSDLEDSIITSAKILDGTIVNADVNDLASSKLTGTIATARLGSGTASSSTILYGDQTYKTEPSGFDVSTITGATALGATPADTDEFILSDAGTLKRVDYSYLKATNQPYFRADTSTQTVGGEATIIFTNSVFDSASGYSTTTGKYTIPSGKGGYWWFQANCTIGASYTGMWLNLKVEGSNRLRGTAYNSNGGSATLSGILNVSAGDEINIAMELGASQGLNGSAYLNTFSGFRLIQ